MLTNGLLVGFAQQLSEIAVTFQLQTCRESANPQNRECSCIRLHTRTSRLGLSRFSHGQSWRGEPVAQGGMAHVTDTRVRLRATSMTIPIELRGRTSPNTLSGGRYKASCNCPEGRAMQGLMQAWPLTLNRIIEHAAKWHGDREVLSRRPDGPLSVPPMPRSRWRPGAFPRRSYRSESCRGIASPPWP